MLLCTVSTVRAPLADLKMFVNYHLNCRVDRMFLFFDDPADASIEYFHNDNRVTCIRCDAAHWASSQLPDKPSIEERQVYNATLALRWAANEGFDWVIHIDSDELVFASGRDLKGYLERIADCFDAVTFPTLEALPNKRYSKHFFEEIHWFKTYKARVPLAEVIARRMGCHRAFKYGYFRAHIAGKTATRVRSPVARVGIQSPIARNGAELNIEVSANVFLLHFDCCTFEDWKLKWKRRVDGTATVSQIREERVWQFNDFLAAYQANSEARLMLEYQRQYIFPTYEKIILVTLGLLRWVDLKDGAFQGRP
jgi:hypothetical protein